MVRAERIPANKTNHRENNPTDDNHNNAVIRTINWYIQETFAPSKSRFENLFNAGGRLTNDRNRSDHHSQSLILRDAQRYFYGAIGDYLWSNRNTLTNQFPSLNKALPGLPFFYMDHRYRTTVGRALNKHSDSVYNLKKSIAIALGFERSIRANPNRPVSGVGGSTWFEYGRSATRGLDLTTKGAPPMASRESHHAVHRALQEGQKHRARSGAAHWDIKARGY